jgi:hypothetical protein
VAFTYQFLCFIIIPLTIKTIQCRSSNNCRGFGWKRSLLKSQSRYDRRSVGQSVLMSRLIWGPRPDLYYCQTLAGLLMWDALSNERTGLSFTIAAGPRQRSHSRVRVPRDSSYCGVPLNTGISESERPSIARQRLGYQVSCIIVWVTIKHVHTTTHT